MLNQKDYKRLLAVDPSLTCSGWALFRARDSALLAVGKVRSLPSSIPLAARLDDFQRKIDQVFIDLELSQDDLVVCEAPTTMRDPAAAIKVEQIRGMFESVARQRKSHVPGRINPRSVQYELMGFGGRQKSRQVVKETALQLVATLYAEDLARLGFSTEKSHLRKHQDIVDAILVGHLAAVRLSSARSSGLPLVSFFQDASRRFSRIRVRAKAA